MPLNWYSHSQIFSLLSFDGVGGRRTARLKPGQLQSGHLGSTCFSEPQMEVEFTQHTQLQHSFNTWTCSTGNFLCAMTTLGRGGLKKAQWGKLDSLQFWKSSVTSEHVCVCVCVHLF